MDICRIIAQPVNSVHRPRYGKYILFQVRRPVLGNLRSYFMLICAGTAAANVNRSENGFAQSITQLAARRNAAALILQSYRLLILAQPGNFLAN